MNNFKVNSFIKECIDNNDVEGIRVALTTIIYGDRNFSKGEFENSLNYVVNTCGIREIFEELDTTAPLICNSVKGRNFNEDDFAEAVYELKVNFCRERIEDVKAISKVLYPIKGQTNGICEKKKAVGGNVPGKKSLNQKEQKQAGIGVTDFIVSMAVFKVSP